MEKENSKTVYDILKSLGIPFRHEEHEYVHTMEDCDKVALSLGAPFFKNLFLQNRQGTEFFLLLIGEDKRFRTADVSKKIGRARLSFGNEDDLFRLLGLRPGAISPMGLIFDAGHEINLLIDSDLKNMDEACMHPCVGNESLSMKMSDFLNVFLPYTGHTPQWIAI